MINRINYLMKFKKYLFFWYSYCCHNHIINKENTMSEVKSYLEVLSKELGIEINSSNSNAIAFNLDGNNVLLQWRELDNSFIVYSEIGNLVGWNDEAICRQLLSANFLLMETEGAALSYDMNANKVGINYVLPLYGLSPEEFLQKLNAVLVLAEKWHANLVAMQKEQEELAEKEDAEIDIPLDQAMIAMNFIKI